ncbi:hypothetical protein ACFLZF_00170 [Nanoarchaeota archaeon]
MEAYAKKNLVKKTLFILSFIFLINFTSATIIMNTQLKEVYNLGDTIELPIEINAIDPIIDTLSMKLLCNGLEIEVLKQDIDLGVGEDLTIPAQIRLSKERLQRPTATCKIKLTSQFKEAILSDEFEVSNKITITPKLKQTEFSPGETIILEGDAIKENQESANGFVEISANIANSSELITTTSSVKNGYFYIEIPLKENAKAGDYSISINVYETNNLEEKTNQGYASKNFKILQVPTSLEIILDEEEVEPGKNIKTKTVLHDQTGEKINSISIITLKNNKDEILEQIELSTQDFFEYTIPHDETPANWTIIVVSDKLNTEAFVSIKEKKDIEIILLNETLKIKNTGNVFYNDSVLIKIGEENLFLNATLKIGEEQEFVLTAPQGEYVIEVMANGKDSLKQSVLLTGKSIDVKETKESSGLFTHLIAWIFVIIIFGFAIFMFLKKGYKKKITEYIKSKKKHDKTKKEHETKFNSLLNFKKTQEKRLIQDYTNKAEISSSIKGTRQDVSIICLKIKNFEEIDVSKVKDTMQKIIDLSEKEKTLVYEDQENIFFLFSPLKTKTFRNEKSALELAQKITRILKNHNKLFKQKIEFGISTNYGTIIAKLENSILKFISFEKIISSSKKIASHSQEEILLDEKIKTKLASSVKAEKKDIGNLIAYSIKEVKKTEDNKKFLEGFIQRMKEEKKK